MVDEKTLEEIFSRIGTYIDPHTGEDLTLQAAVYVANELAKNGITSFDQIEKRISTETREIGWRGARETVTVVKYFNKNTGQQINEVLLDDKAGTRFVISDQGMQRTFDPIQKIAFQIRPYIDPTSTGGAWTTQSGRNSGPGFGPEGMIREIATRLVNQTGIQDISELAERTVNRDRQFYLSPKYERFIDGADGPVGINQIGWQYNAGDGDNPDMRFVSLNDVKNVSQDSEYNIYGTITLPEKEAFNTRTGQAVNVYLGDWGQGPGMTSAGVSFDESGKIKIRTYGQDTTSSWIAPVLAFASIFPPTAPFAIAANIAISLDRGDILGAVASAAGLAGFKEVAAVARIAKAVETGDILGAALATFNVTGIGNTELIPGVTINNVLRVASAAKAIENGDYGSALVLAGETLGKQELVKAGQGVKLVQAMQSGDIGKVSNAFMAVATSLNQENTTSKQITNAQNANIALRGSPLTPQQIESHVANGGNPEDLVVQQTGLRQEQVQAIGEAVTAYNNKEIDIYQFESRLKQSAGLSTDQADLVVNRVFNDNQVAITRQQNAVRDTQQGIS